jgi:hypothetical protein
MVVEAMIFPFLLYLLLLLLLSHLHHLRNDQLVCDLAYRMMLLYGVLCHLLRLHLSSVRQMLLLLHLFVLKVVGVGNGIVVGEKRGVEYRCPWSGMCRQEERKSERWKERWRMKREVFSTDSIFR